jgi:hypothetical protein
MRCRCHRKDHSQRYIIVFRFIAKKFTAGRGPAHQMTSGSLHQLLSSTREEKMKKKPIYAFSALFCGVLLALASCSGGGSGSGGSTNTGGSANPTAPTNSLIPAPGTPTASSNGCFNLDLAYTAGTTSNISYTSQGTAGGIASGPTVLTAESVLDGNVTLDGKTVFKTSTKASLFDQTGKKSSETMTTGYAVRSGSAQTTTLRLDSSITAFAGNTTSLISQVLTYNPGFVDPSPGMVLGSTAEYPQKGTGITTISPPGSTTTEILDKVIVRKFVAIENITIPAGTYTACRFEEWDKANPAFTTTFWVTYGIGAYIKVETKGPGVAGIQQATSITLNGKKL